MATPMPFPFKPQIPATPPPDQQAFAKGPLSPEMSSVSPAQESYKPPVGAHIQNDHRAPPRPTTAPTGPDFTKLSELAQDPRYLAMASRIASYYQQRCQAVANYQQQRCQAWANMHRQKCQEMTQAAMLIVAWYIRDRISRRRKRQKRQFKKRLSEKCARTKITKGESVRRWVMDVPLGAMSPSNNPVHDNLVDEEEKTFSMDKDPNPDKDTQLFNIADNLIKSQLARIDVPLLGALSFDESESESDDDYMRDYDEEEEEEYEEDEDYKKPDDRDGDHAGNSGDGKGDSKCEPGMGSEEVQLGTGQGSRNRTSSSLS